MVNYNIFKIADNRKEKIKPNVNGIQERERHDSKEKYWTAKNFIFIVFQFRKHHHMEMPKKPI